MAQESRRLQAVSYEDQLTKKAAREGKVTSSEESDFGCTDPMIRCAKIA